LILSGEVTPDEMRMRARPSKLGEFSAMAWSPDGALLATSSTGSYIRLWSMPRGELIGFLPFNAVKQLAFSPDGGLLVSQRIADNQSIIRIHRVSDLTEMRVIQDVQPAFSISGERLAFMRNGSQRMEIQNLTSGAALHAWDADMGLSSVVFSPGGNVLHGVDPWGRETRSWQSYDGKLLSVEKAGIGEIRAIAIDPEGQACVTGGSNQSITLRSLVNDVPQVVLSGHEDEIQALAVSPDGRLIASGGTDRTLRLWQVPSNRSGQVASTAKDFRTVDASPDGRMWLGTSNGDEIILRSFGKPPRSMAEPGDRKPLGFDETGGHFLTWREDRSEVVVEWWNCGTLALAESCRLTPGFPGPWVIGVSPRGRLLGCCGSRTPVVVIDLRGGSVVHRFPAPELLPVRMEFSPDESKILVAAWPRTARVGNIGANWNPSFHLTTGTVGPIVFSPDGRLLVSGGDDNTISVRDPETGRLLRELRGHRSQIMALAFTPDGRSLASSGADRTLRLWHASTWRSLGAIDADRLHSFIRFDVPGEKLLVVPWQEDAFFIPREPAR
jgi:WD40 repeat protein